MTMKWMIGLVAALALGVLTLPVWMHSEEQAPAASGVPSCKAEGQANLDLTMKDMNGAEVKLADYKGKVVLLNFWATWCPPCLAEIPEFIKVYDEKKNDGFAILGVSTDDTADQLQAFASEHKISYPLLMITPDVEDAYGPLFGLPTSVLIARDGSVCKRHFGPMSKEQLEKEIKPLL
jgi:peroxiredoxin